MKADDHSAEEHSKRKRIAAIIGRWAGAAIPSSSPDSNAPPRHQHHSQHHPHHEDPQRSSPDPVSSSSAAFPRSLTDAANTTARQSASILSAMAASAKNTTNATAEKLAAAPNHDDDERYPFESPLKARRRLAAIATQLGLATSAATQSSSSRPLASVLGQNDGAEDHFKWDHLPKYRELPSEGGYPGCAWSVWGKGDQLGTVNLLTDAVVARSARDEIRTGTRITLNWPLHLPHEPFFKRQPVVHKAKAKGGEFYTKQRDAAIDALKKEGLDVVNRGQDTVPVNDDTLELNTQSGSQWDGLRHYGHLGLDCFYGGVAGKTLWDKFGDQSPQASTPEGLISDASRDRNQLGVHHLAQRGICGRGVLLDVFGHLSTKSGGQGWRGHAYDPSRGYRITAQDLQETARAQGVQFRQGDILLIRSGFTYRYYNSTAEERKDWVERLELAGVDQSEEMKAFLWDNHFAAVAGDAPAFESRPALPGHLLLHETLLGLWGMPIGEMFDLEALTAHARQHDRWTFFFSSWPLNLYGGVASTANAAAIF